MPDFNSFKEYFCRSCGTKLYAWQSRKLCEQCEKRVVSHEKKQHSKEKQKSKKHS